MPRIIALHGNPGSAQDWAKVKSLLPSQYEMIAVDVYQNTWQQLILQSNEKVILLAHSWGAYQALKSLPLIRDKITQIILINPYLIPENPLPAVAAPLLQTPWLGDRMIASSHKKSVATFFENLIYPEKLNDRQEYITIQKSLENVNNWKKAALAKLEMQKNPLEVEPLSPISSHIPITVIWGEQDKIADKDIQLSLLKNNQNIKFLFLKDSGHNSIWSHPEKINEVITMKDPKTNQQQETKIGYHAGQSELNNVISYMEKHLKEFPERIALKWVSRQNLAQWDGDMAKPLPHDSINYRNFATRINSFAKGLIDIGIQKGDRVIIFLPMSLDMYTAMFAVQRIGAIAVFLDSWARSHHLGASAECVDPKAMISFKQAFDLVDQVPEFKSMPIRIMYGPGENCTHRFEQLLKQEISPIAAVESEYTALITFTTGSTGKPKGANRTHRFLSAQHHALSHVIPYTDRDSDMPAFPIFSLNNLATGVTTILPALDLAAPSAKDSAILANQIIHEKITCTTLSPSMLVGLAKFCSENNIQLSGLRRVVTGGAPISKDDVRNFYAIAPQTEIWILYGSTEAEPMAHIEGRDMLKENANKDPEVVEEGVNVGHISDDIDFKFVKIIDGPVSLPNGDWSGVELAAGEVGEFICTGDHVCRDYYNNTEAFKTTKILDSKNRVWHRTGDLAYIDKDKNLWIVGRVNNAITRGGKYYFPVRAEVLLKRFDFVARCAFLGLDDDKLGQANCIAIELKKDLDLNSFDKETAKSEILRVFAKNNIPVDKIFLVESVPMDPRHHSKVEYKVLRELLLKEGAILV
ncbi:MAG: alpha/beta fold hydrolase [Bdellovibrionia bacterium]